MTDFFVNGYFERLSAKTIKKNICHETENKFKFTTYEIVHINRRVYWHNFVDSIRNSKS